jgi:hypothetical protein
MLSSIEFTAEKAIECKKNFEINYNCPCFIVGKIWNGKPIYRIFITEDIIPF